MKRSALFALLGLAVGGLLGWLAAPGRLPESLAQDRKVPPAPEREPAAERPGGPASSKADSPGAILIRNANLAVREHTGYLVDPLGKPSITGNFDVVRNDGMVRDVLASLQTKVASR